MTTSVRGGVAPLAFAKPTWTSRSATVSSHSRAVSGCGRADRLREPVDDDVVDPVGPGERRPDDRGLDGLLRPVAHHHERGLAVAQALGDIGPVERVAVGVGVADQAGEVLDRGGDLG